MLLSRDLGATAAAVPEAARRLHGCKACGPRRDGSAAACKDESQSDDLFGSCRTIGTCRPKLPTGCISGADRAPTPWWPCQQPTIDRRAATARPSRCLAARPSRWCAAAQPCRRRPPCIASGCARTGPASERSAAAAGRRRRRRSPPEGLISAVAARHALPQSAAARRHRLHGGTAALPHGCMAAWRHGGGGTARLDVCTAARRARLHGETAARWPHGAAT